MNDNNVIVHTFPFKIEHAIPNGLLTGVSSFNNPFKFVNMELPGIGPHNFLPAVDADDFYGINQRMSLKSLQCVN